MTTDTGSRDGQVSLYATAAILDRIDPMLREIPGVLASEDPEHLHRMRVASRRLRMALRLLAPLAGLANPRGFFKLARAVTGTLGEARDLDVQIDWLDEFAKGRPRREFPGIARVALRMRQRREKAQPKVARLVSGLADDPILTDALRRLREAKLLAEMSGADDPLRDMERATKVICLQLDVLLACSLSLGSPDAAAEHHRLRIEAKHLRYAMEIFGGLYEGGLAEPIALVRKLQSLLGDLHDADVWTGTMPLFIEDEKKRAMRYYGNVKPFARLQCGCEAIARDREAFRAAQYERARLFCEETRQEGKWDGLRALVLGAYRGRWSIAAARDQAV